MESKILRYPGVDVTVTYDVKRCIHAAACVKGSPDVFNPDRKPWVDPDLASAEKVSEVVMHCPTGALKFDRHDDDVEEPVPDTNTMKIAPDGPLYVRGNITLKSAEGDVLLEDTRIALCRCGASNNKPLCDGSHTRAGFVDPGEMPDPKLKPLEDANGPTTLTVLMAHNGPMLLDGPVHIASADGAVGVEGGKGALCRCGSSSNKPFCDGTHKTIGFEA